MSNTKERAGFDAFWHARTNTERGEYVTEQVALWITNDGDHIESAQAAIREGGAHCVGDYLSRTLKSAAQFSAAWYVAQELAPNDYSRIDWVKVAEELKA